MQSNRPVVKAAKLRESDRGKSEKTIRTQQSFPVAARDQIAADDGFNPGGNSMMLFPLMTPWIWLQVVTASHVPRYVDTPSEPRQAARRSPSRAASEPFGDTFAATGTD
jgi:hypothetical protein